MPVVAARICNKVELVDSVNPDQSARSVQSDFDLHRPLNQLKLVPALYGDKAGRTSRIWPLLDKSGKSDYVNWTILSPNNPSGLPFP